KMPVVLRVPIIPIAQFCEDSAGNCRCGFFVRVRGETKNCLQVTVADERFEWVIRQLLRRGYVRKVPFETALLALQQSRAIAVVRPQVEWIKQQDEPCRSDGRIPCINGRNRGATKEYLNGCAHNVCLRPSSATADFWQQHMNLADRVFDVHT